MIGFHEFMAGEEKKKLFFIKYFLIAFHSSPRWLLDRRWMSVLL